MRKTIPEQIKEAKRAYLVTISNAGSTLQRYSCYLDNGNGLDVLWPSDSHLKKSKEIGTVGMTYSKNKNFVAYHFVSDDHDTNHIAMRLKKHNPTLEVFEINGAMPWNI